jgi:SAM-dependent methyltransferase
MAATAMLYDEYAPIYDMTGQDRVGAQLAASTLQSLGEVPVRRVLDLACGNGAAALVFAATGVQVVGVDRSAAMLEIARGRARDAGHEIVFVKHDIRDLPMTSDSQSRMEDRGWRMEAQSSILHPPSSILGGPWSFDLVTCFGALNEATEDGDLGRVFGGVAAALRAGGRLVFDLTAEAEYATWDERDVVAYDGPDCLVYNRLSYDPETPLATRRIVWFIRETERWWRGEETHVERAWGDAEVRAALASAGLALETRSTPEGGEVSADTTRVIYVALKV